MALRYIPPNSPPHSAALKRYRSRPKKQTGAAGKPFAAWALRAPGVLAVMNLTCHQSRSKLLIRNKTFGFERVGASKMAIPG